MSKGWIKLYREIKDHWIYQEPRKFSKYEAWVDLLMSANYKDNKFVLGNDLIEVKRGQFVTSIRKLENAWDWSNTKVENFLELLQKDGMIELKKDKKKTVISIVNYDIYHPLNDTENTINRHENDIEQAQKHTNKKEKNCNKEDDINKDTYKDTDEADFYLSKISLEREKDELLKNSLKNDIPPLTFKSLKIFSESYDEMYKWFGIILRAKKKVEQNKNVLLLIEEIDEELNSIMTKGIRKIKKDKGIISKDDYLFSTVYNGLEKLSVEINGVNSTYQFFNWLES